MVYNPSTPILAALSKSCQGIAGYKKAVPVQDSIKSIHAIFIFTIGFMQSYRKRFMKLIADIAQ